MRQKYHSATDNGILIWDVTSILEDIEQHPDSYTIQTLSTALLADHNDARVSHTRAMASDLTKPLVVAELSKDHLLLIDGNHRLPIKPERLVLKIFRAIIFLRNSSSILLCISDHLNMSTLLPVFHKNQLLPFRLFIIDTKTVPGIVSSVSVPERLILLYFFSVYFTICTSMLPERKPSASNVI